jgi:hypothetical protein
MFVNHAMTHVIHEYCEIELSRGMENPTSGLKVFQRKKHGELCDNEWFPYLLVIENLMLKISIGQREVKMH